MEKTKESPSKYICSNPNVLPSCENEKSNIEKQADLVEEIAFKNLKVKKPITYTEEEVLNLLNKFDNMELRPERKLDFEDIRNWFNQNKKK